MSEKQAEYITDANEMIGKGYRIEGRPSTIFKVVHDKDNPYITINTTPILNEYLSWKAKGILTYLMSRPDGWEVSVSDLVNRSTDGKASVRAGLKELRDAGHMRYTVSRNEGKITGWNIEVYELPQGKPNDDYPTDEIIDNEPPQVGDTTMRKSVSGGEPESDFQEVENQQIENRTQVLKTLSNKDSNKSTTTRANSGDVFRAYENEIGLLTPHSRDCINDYLDNLKIPPDWIIEAIHIAREQQKPNWAYCAAILKRWAVEGKTALPPKINPRGPKYPNKPRGDNTDFFEKLARA